MRKNTQLFPFSFLLQCENSQIPSFRFAYLLFGVEGGREECSRRPHYLKHLLLLSACGFHQEISILWNTLFLCAIVLRQSFLWSKLQGNCSTFLRYVVNSALFLTVCGTSVEEGGEKRLLLFSGFCNLHSQEGRKGRHLTGTDCRKCTQYLIPSFSRQKEP